MKEIINISTNSPNTNFSKIIEFAGQKFRITHYGVDLNIKLYCDLVTKHDGRADVIAISGGLSGDFGLCSKKRTVGICGYDFC